MPCSVVYVQGVTGGPTQGSAWCRLVAGWVQAGDEQFFLAPPQKAIQVSLRFPYFCPRPAIAPQLPADKKEPPSDFRVVGIKSCGSGTGQQESTKALEGG